MCLEMRGGGQKMMQKASVYGSSQVLWKPTKGGLLGRPGIWKVKCSITFTKIFTNTDYFVQLQLLTGSC